MSDLKPPQKFDGEQLEAVVDAIAGGYDYSDWSRLLLFKWGLVLANYVNPQQGFRGVVADLVAWTERKGKTRELLALARADNPGNENLRLLATMYGLTSTETDQKYNTTTLEKPSNLEALVNSHSRLIDYAQFMSRLKGVADRICVVETPFKEGTGFLVASDQLITNYHVVEEIIANPCLANKINCSFDFRGDGGAIIGIKRYELRANRVIASSPYDESDLTGAGEPNLDKLDYAILQLGEKIGNLPGSANSARGWFDLVQVADRPVVALHDFLLIPQHPGGDALKISWGNVVSFPGAGSRVRYDATTANGSSGSPCFTLDLDIIGLHHAAEPQNKPRYNQAIPIWLIAKDLETKSPVNHGTS
jgi:hypothetical protein